MSRARPPLLSLFALLFILGACQSEGKIQGEVFIVTEGRENIEMGLVEVGAIQAEKLNKIIKEKLKKSKRETKNKAHKIGKYAEEIRLKSVKNTELSEILERRKNKISKIVSKTENKINNKESIPDIKEERIMRIKGGPKVGEELTIVSKNAKVKKEPMNMASSSNEIKTRVGRGESGVIIEIDTLWENYRVDFGDVRGWIWRYNAIPTKKWDKIKDKKEDIESDIQKKSSKLEELKSSVDKIQSNISKKSERINTLNGRINKKIKEVIYYRSNAFFFSSLPSFSDADKTDSDGRYELTVETGVPYYVVAEAERSVSDDEERYYWMVKTTVSGGETKELNLTNDNLGGVANKKYALNERTLSTVEGIWQSAISLAKEGEEMNWEKLIYRTAFPEDTTEVPIPDELDVPEEKLLSNR